MRETRRRTFASPATGEVLAYARVAVLEGFPIVTEYGYGDGAVAALADLLAAMVDEHAAASNLHLDPELERALESRGFSLHRGEDPTGMLRCIDPRRWRDASASSRPKAETPAASSRRSCPPSASASGPLTASSLHLGDVLRVLVLLEEPITQERKERPRPRHGSAGIPYPCFMKRRIRELLFGRLILTLALLLGVMQVVVGHWVTVVLAGREGPGLGVGLALAALLVAANAYLVPVLRRARRRGGFPGLIARAYMGLGCRHPPPRHGGDGDRLGFLPIGGLLLLLGVSAEWVFLAFRVVSIPIVGNHRRDAALGLHRADKPSRLPPTCGFPWRTSPKIFGAFASSRPPTSTSATAWRVGASSGWWSGSTTSIPTWW